MKESYLRTRLYILKTHIEQLEYQPSTPIINKTSITREKIQRINHRTFRLNHINISKALS